MNVALVRDEAGFAALEPFWDALVDRSAVCTPFMRWDWVRFWWEEFRQDFSLAIGVARDVTGRVLAIAPLIIGMETDGMRRHLRHLGFLGGLGTVKGERMDFIVPAGQEQRLTPLLCQVFRMLDEEWEAVRLNKLPEESPNYPHVIEALNTCSAGAGVALRSECACMQLADSWPKFEKKLPKKHQRKLRTRQDALRAAHPVEMTQAAGAEVTDRLDEFALLHAQRHPEGESGFLVPAAWRFHRRLALKWLHDGRAMLPFIQVETKMVGGVYGFVERDEFFFFQIGWDPDYAQYVMGHLSIGWAVKTCIGRGLRVFDMLPGTYRYKNNWSQTRRYVIDLEAYRPGSVRAQTFLLFRQLKRLLARIPTPSLHS